MFKKLSLLIVSVLILLLYVPPVYANGGMGMSIPIFLAYGAPVYLFMMTFGVSFLAVVAIETYVIQSRAKIGWGKSFGEVLKMNIVSTFGGVMFLFAFISPCSAFLMMPLVPVAFSRRLKDRKAPPYFVRAAVYTYFMGLISALLITYYVGTEPLNGSDYILFGLPIFTGFGISLFIEALVVSSSRLPALWGPLLIANVWSYVFLAITYPITSLYFNNFR